MRTGVLNIASDAVFYLSEERGYLREEGLELETTRFDSAQRICVLFFSQAHKPREPSERLSPTSE